MRALREALAWLVAAAMMVIGAARGLLLFGLFTRFSLWFTRLVLGW